MAMDHPKISIITTVYKTGHYLPLTVQSILAQTFTDFELLLVDDGSPDNSGEVADALAKTDARIRVFHKENGGPASASNMGLDNARGDYIGFVDSDDLIAPDMYEKLYAAVQAPGVRLAACAGDCIDEDGSKIEGRVVTSDLRGVHDAQELLLDAFKTGTFYGPLSWNQNSLLPGASFYPSATSSTIISTNPTANPTVPRFECSPSEASGISSSTTT